MKCDSIHGTFKITGIGSFAIENCGDCDCHLVIKQVEDNAVHPPYDEVGLITDDSQLPLEVLCSNIRKVNAWSWLCEEVHMY